METLMSYVLAKFKVTSQVSMDEFERYSIDKLFFDSMPISEIFKWYDEFKAMNKSDLIITRIEPPQ